MAFPLQLAGKVGVFVGASAINDYHDAFFDLAAERSRIRCHDSIQGSARLFLHLPQLWTSQIVDERGMFDGSIIHPTGRKFKKGARSIYLKPSDLSEIVESFARRLMSIDQEATKHGKS
jgi:hypothetical protein